VEPGLPKEKGGGLYLKKGKLKRETTIREGY